MLSIVTLRVPESCGKACVEAVMLLWDGCVSYMAAIHTSAISGIRVWKTRGNITTLYTKCIHKYTQLVDSITSVIGRFYTQFTGLTNITTTLYITI